MSELKELKDLQEMAKNGEISKKLLDDKDFLIEFKKLLKEENGMDATDEEVSNIIKKLEKTLQDKQILQDAETANISGGSVAYRSVMIGSRLAGSAAGFLLGGLCDGIVQNAQLRQAGLPTKASFTKGYRAGLGFGLGTWGGHTLGKFICKKLNIKN